MANQSDKSQSDKFKDLAREVEADEDERPLDEALRRMRKKPGDQRDKGPSDE